MWSYWLMLFVPALGAISSRRLPVRQAKWAWVLVGLAFALLIGLREEVGGDWYAYLDHFYRVGDLDVSELISQSDLGYYGLSWVIAQLGGNVYCLNLLCALILCTGTCLFAREQPNPWLAFLTSVPYLLIVVGMGYTRQSAAIGFVLIGLVMLGRGQARRFVFWVVVGALFHKTAVLLLPIAALAATKRRLWTWFWVGVIALLGTWFFLYDVSQELWKNYVTSDYSEASEGGPVRVIMNAVPAILLLLLRKHLVSSEIERRLWNWVALWALACVPLLFLSATAVDRIALYFIPLQLYSFSRFPRIAKTPAGRTLIVLGIIVYYAGVQFVWLNFASHADSWLPYQSVLFS
jgi:hypothetical protein